MVKYIKSFKKSAYDLLFDFQTRLQGVGNSLGSDIAKFISTTDRAVLDAIVSQLPQYQSSVKEQMRKLAKLVKTIEEERAKGFNLAQRHLFDAGPDIIKAAGKTVASLAEQRGSRFKKELPQKTVSEILNYHPVDGKSISQWFGALQAADLERITQTVQRATVEGLSVANVVKAIRGTKENDYKDGVLETTRQSATMTARTVINGVASNAMLETCAENSDVIDGIKFISTLDAKTCPFCGAYDGKIWKPDEAALVKRPPLHPNCRCTVIPYIDLGEGTEGKRPAANADFDKLAEDAYNQQAREKGLERRYEDLAPSTKLKYFYEAQKRYEKETGKPAFSQVKGDTSFKDYFENQSEEFKRSWLGPKRYDLYQQGQYDPLQLGNPDTGYVVPVQKLEEELAIEQPANGDDQEIDLDEIDDTPESSETDDGLEIDGEPMPGYSFEEDFSDYSRKTVGMHTTLINRKGEEFEHLAYTDQEAPSIRDLDRVDDLYRKNGINIPQSKTYEVASGVHVRATENVLSDKSLTPLDEWWKNASDEEKEKLRPAIGKADALGVLLDNQISSIDYKVDKNGELWAMNAEGARGTHENGRSLDLDFEKTVKNLRNSYNNEPGALYNKVKEAASLDLSDYLKTLTPGDREIVEARQERLRIAKENAEWRMKKEKVTADSARIERTILVSAETTLPIAKDLEDKREGFLKARQTDVKEAADLWDKLERKRLNGNLTPEEVVKQEEAIAVGRRDLEWEHLTRKVDRFQPVAEKWKKQGWDSLDASERWQYIQFQHSIGEYKKNPDARAYNEAYRELLLGPPDPQSVNYSVAQEVKMFKLRSSAEEKEEFRKGLMLTARIDDLFGSRSPFVRPDGTANNGLYTHKSARKGCRSCYNTAAKMIHLVNSKDDKWNSGTVVHENAHAEDDIVRRDNQPQINNLRRRHVTTKTEKLRDLTGCNYRDKEVANLPADPMYFPDIYCAKDYGRSATECNSMFRQMIAENPLVLTQYFEEFYEDMIAANLGLYN